MLGGFDLTPTAALDDQEERRVLLDGRIHRRNAEELPPVVGESSFPAATRILPATTKGVASRGQRGKLPALLRPVLGLASLVATSTPGGDLAFVLARYPTDNVLAGCVRKQQ